MARAVLVGEPLAPVRAAARWVASPLPAFALFNGTLLAWHLPALYDLTLRDGPVHDLEHALFFGTRAAVLGAPGAEPRGRSSPTLGRVAYGAGAMLVSWLLAVVLGLAPTPLYSGYASPRTGRAASRRSPTSSSRPG